MDKERIYEVLYRYKTTIKEELSLKEEFIKFIESLADEIFSEFYNVLLSNNRYKDILRQEVIAYLVNRQKDFLKMWLFEEVSKKFADDVYHIINVHYMIGLNDIDMLYGVSLLGEIIVEKINRYLISNEDKKNWARYVLSRTGLLKIISETSYQLNEEEKAQYRYEAYDLYSFVEAHLGSLNKVLVNIKNDIDLSTLNIATNSKACPLQSLLDTMFEFKVIDGSMYKALSLFHQRWHETYKELITDKSKIEELKQISKNMIEFINNYYSYTEDIFLVNSTLIVQEFINLNTHILINLNRSLSEMQELNKDNIEESLRKALFLYSHLIGDFEITEADLDKPENSYKYEKYITIHSSDFTYIIRFKLSDALIHISSTNEKIGIMIDKLFNLSLEIIKLILEYRNTLIKSRELLVKAESYAKSKDIFLANMSHELRTPLNAIIGFSQILSKRKDIPENIKSYIDKINIAGKTLLELINNVLDFAKIESGKIQIKPYYFELSNLFNEVRSIIEPLAKGKQLTLEIKNHLEDDKVNLDYTLMKQVLMNLLSNAVKFTPEGGKISVEAVSVDDKNIQISVCDTGVGIAKEDLNKLFQPFTQLENPMQKSVKGTGLGLVIIKRIIEMHSGNIWVESEVGKGTCFRFNIPRNVELSNLLMEINTGKEYTVFILEDDKLFGNMLVDCLKYDFNILWVSSLGAFRMLKEKVNQDKTFYILDFFVKEGISSSLFDEIDKTKTLVLSAEDRLQEIPEDIKFLNKSYVSCNDIKSQILKALKGE